MQNICFDFSDCEECESADSDYEYEDGIEETAIIQETGE